MVSLRWASFEGDRQPKLIDFGLSRIRANKSRQLGGSFPSALGTLNEDVKGIQRDLLQAHVGA